MGGGGEGKARLRVGLRGDALGHALLHALFTHGGVRRRRQGKGLDRREGVG